MPDPTKPAPPVDPATSEVSASGRFSLKALLSTIAGLAILMLFLYLANR